MKLILKLHFKIQHYFVDIACFWMWKGTSRLLTRFKKIVYLLSSLFIIWPMMVVLSTYFTVEFSRCVGVQSWGYSVNRRGLSTQPWGAPVLSTNIEEVWLPVWTVCGLFVRKSIVLLVWYSGPECLVFLSASLEKLYRSKTYKQHCDEAVLILQLWEDWVEVSGYGVLCGSVASENILMRIQIGKDVVFDVLQNQILKTFHQKWGDGNKVVVI